MCGTRETTGADDDGASTREPTGSGLLPATVSAAFSRGAEDAGETAAAAATATRTQRSVNIQSFSYKCSSCNVVLVVVVDGETVTNDTPATATAVSMKASAVDSSYSAAVYYCISCVPLMY